MSSAFDIFQTSLFAFCVVAFCSILLGIAIAWITDAFRL